MSITQCKLDGNDIRSLDDLYDQLSAQLSLSAHFGRNLDALWDALSTDVAGPFKIIWEHAEISKKHMGKDFERAVMLLKDLKKERDDFTLKIENK
ncbi:MAG TPA: barstar family protein [Dissulfurispiraceae bacterium]|nr:barstar family protein [Dissulfurispiraceae bacterium]